MKTLFKKYFLLFSILFTIYSVDCKGQMGWNWVKSLGGNGDQWVNDLVVDTLGNIYVAGAFYNQVTIGNLNFYAIGHSRYGGFVAKYDSSGSFIWAKQINKDTEDKYSNALVLDKNQNVYVTGYKIFGNQSSGYMFVNKYSKDGNNLWSQSFNDFFLDWQSIKHKTIGLLNNVICVTGHDSIYTINTSGNLIARKSIPANCISDDGKNYFYSASGNQITIIDSSINVINTISIDSSYFNINSLVIRNKNIYVTGGGDPLHQGYAHMFVSKMDSMGITLWTKTGQPEPYASAAGNEILLDQQNNVCVAGFYRNVVKFDSITVGAFGLFSEIFVSKYNDVTGRLEDFIHAGGDNEDMATCLAITPGGNLVTSGYVQQATSVSLDFGDTMVISPGQNFFIANISKSYFSATIKGQVTLNSMPFHSGITLFRKNTDSTFTVTYTGLTDNSGNYSYTVHKPISLIVRSNDFNQVATYYTQTYLWSLANQIDITKDTTINNVNISILQCSPQTGNDSISGAIYSYNGNPKSFIHILLVTINDQIVSYTQSDTLGNYYFGNVSKGIYKILVDSAGAYMNSYYTIVDTVNIKNSPLPLTGRSFTHYDYTFGNDHKIYENNSVTSVNQNENSSTSVVIYPNPTNGFFIIQANSKKLAANIQIHNVLGEIVLQSAISSQQTTIDISTQPSGIYFLKITNQDGSSAVKKIIKE